MGRRGSELHLHLDLRPNDILTVVLYIKSFLDYDDATIVFVKIQFPVGCETYLLNIQKEFRYVSAVL